MGANVVVRLLRCHFNEVTTLAANPLLHFGTYFLFGLVNGFILFQNSHLNIFCGTKIRRLSKEFFFFFLSTEKKIIYIQMAILGKR